VCVFLSPSCRLNIHHKDGMRQPDMTFILCQESDHLPEAGGGCSGTPYRNIRILIPCVVRHLPGKLQTIPSVKDLMVGCCSVAEITFLPSVKRWEIKCRQK
jgi:hypothetical protein